MPDVKVFPCPNCKEFVASDARVCRFCKTPLDETAIQRGVEAQAGENKRFRRGHYRRHLLVGGGLCALGLVITIGTFTAAATSREGGSYVVTYGLIFVGGIDFLYGLVGLIEEMFSK
jgi:hypothetical protein